MKKIGIFLFGFFSLNSALASTFSSRTIFGTDNRVPMPAGRPWQQIGKVSTSSGFCTGALVAPCLVLTAAHCIDPVSGHVNRFESSKAGLSANSVAIYRGTTAPDQDWGNDWGLLVLGDRLGDGLGWMDVQLLQGPDFNPQKSFVLAGYAADLLNGGQHASADTQVTIYKTFANSVVYHDGNDFSGDSGGPIFRLNGDQGVVVAVHTRGSSSIFPAYSDAHASIGVASQAFIPTLLAAQEKWCPF